MYVVLLIKVMQPALLNVCLMMGLGLLHLSQWLHFIACYLPKGADVFLKVLHYVNIMTDTSG
jgi:hypothetical protein